MRRRIDAIWLLVSVASGMHEDLEAAACTAPVAAEWERCLIQHSRTNGVVLQTFRDAHDEDTKVQARFAEALVNVDTGISREYRTGKVVDVQFANGSLDMESVTVRPYSDFADVVAPAPFNSTKQYIEMSFNLSDGGKIVANPHKYRILMFGFKKGTDGLKNSKVNRVWTGDPRKKGSKKVYGFIMKADPSKQPWNYSIDFAKTPPRALKVYPEGGKVYQVDDNLMVTMTCDDELECQDGKIAVSAMRFSPSKKESKEELEDPEEILKLVKTDNSAPGRVQEEPLGPMLEDALTLMGDEKTLWTGDNITLDLSGGSLDLNNATTKYMSNWNFDGSAVSNATKPYVESMLTPLDYEKEKLLHAEAARDATVTPAPANGPRVHSTPQVDKDGVRLYGFSLKASGIANVVNNRFWTKQPKTNGASLVYAVQVLNVPKIEWWTYSIQYTKTPPSAVQVFPKGEKVRRSKAGHLYIVLSCDDQIQCSDESIQISKIAFEPKDKKMPKPEEVNSTSLSNASSASTGKAFEGKALSNSTSPSNVSSDSTGKASEAKGLSNSTSPSNISGESTGTASDAKVLNSAAASKATPSKRQASRADSWFR